MSYTPPTRPPMMGTMIPPPPYGFPSMLPPPGMLPVRPPLLPPGMPPLKPIVDRSQATTVFVGNISERAPDAMIRQMLQRCGNVLNWKRAAGANGKLQAFGFCEYDNPDSTLRCIRLLNGYEIAEKKILVKVDQKTRDFLSEHIKKIRVFDPSRSKMKQRHNAHDSDGSDVNLEYIDENTLKEDRTVLNSFETIIRQYAKDLIPQEVVAPVAEIPTPTSDKPDTPTTPVETKIEEVKEKEKEKEKERDKDKEREPRHRSPIDRRRERSPVKRRASPYEDRPRSGSIPRREIDRDFHKENRQEETEEQKERRRLERKLREKELAYRERLDAWESREQKKRNEYAIEKKKDVQRHKILVKEAKKLKQFLEDYDDLKDDAVYYKGSTLEKKLKIREKEIEADNRDRLKEKEELDELKRKLSEKGVENLDAEAKRIQNDENIRLKRKFEKFDESSSSSSEDEQASETETGQLSDLNPNKVAEKSDKIDTDGAKLEAKMDEDKTPDIDTPQETEVHTPVEKSELEDNSMSMSDSPMKMESPSGSNSPLFSGILKQNINMTTVKIRSVNQKNTIVVNKNQAFAEEEEDQSVAAKKARMIQNMNMEEKKRAVKKLVESIPTDRDELFNFAIDWMQLDDGLMEKRIKPWINKKIIEYIGEEEESLNDFICSKIRQQTKPDKLLEEVKVVLDEEAELFVKKMWRLLVYETEAKRLGISK